MSINQINQLCSAVKDNWALCQLFEGAPHAGEKEFMIAETIHACRLNHAEHGQCFSFRGNIQDSGGGLAQNVSSYRWLVENKYFAEDKFNGKTVIIPTDKLLEKVAGHVGVSLEGRAA